MYPHYLYAVVPLCVILAVVFIAALPITDVLGGLAYLSHPYAIAYIGATLFFLLFVHPETRFIDRFKALLRTLTFIVLILLPWLLWSKFIGLESDLVSQNFFIPGQSAKDFLWTRVVNLASTFQASYLMQYPFDLERYISQSSVNAVGALGLIPVLFLLPSFARLHENYVASLTIYTAALSAILLTLIFSNLAMPALHGFQAFLPLLLLLALKLPRNISR
jgi:hypothetical protein